MQENKTLEELQSNCKKLIEAAQFAMSEVSIDIGQTLQNRNYAIQTAVKKQSNEAGSAMLLAIQRLKEVLGQKENTESLQDAIIKLQDASKEFQIATVGIMAALETSRLGTNDQYALQQENQIAGDIRLHCNIYKEVVENGGTDRKKNVVERFFEPFTTIFEQLFERLQKICIGKDAAERMADSKKHLKTFAKEAYTSIHNTSSDLNTFEKTPHQLTKNFINAVEKIQNNATSIIKSSSVSTTKAQEDVSRNQEVKVIREKGAVNKLTPKNLSTNNKIFEGDKYIKLTSKPKTSQLKKLQKQKKSISQDINH